MITYWQVTLAEGKPVIQTMLPKQWLETGDSALSCEPNWRLYEALDKVGNGKLVLAYEDDRPIGYGAMVIHPHLNSNVMAATISTYYAEPRPSRGLIVKGIIEALMKLLPENVARVFLETEYNHSAGRIWEVMGFTPVKVGYRLDRRL